jgi:ADP-ribose diphosphatase
MADEDALVDRAADISLSPPELLAAGYRDYQRYHIKLKPADGAAVEQERDIIRAGKVAVVLPVDPARDEIVLVRQFRLAAHLANGRGDLVETVAGRVEPDETVEEAARRECQEEIGVAPVKLVELFSFLSSPGFTDEEVTVFLAAVDATQVTEGAHASPDGEQLHILRVSIDAALQALARGSMRNSLLVIALQWLALNRGRIGALLRGAPAR